uniref:KIB1-4 beta-propeller domain-containing protein n=1 Tax=Hordeum vulgare subsp. vulgare TaxID=112509 RepID=A0A8I6XQ35_HORVV
MDTRSEAEKLKGPTVVSVSPFPLDPGLAPLLLFDYQHDGEASGGDTIFLYSIPKRQLLGRRADGFKGHRYWLTPQGWVLMLHLESHKSFLWNPSTLERISLPLDQENLLQAAEGSMCLLSLKPTDPDCVVLLADLAHELIYYCHAGGNQWFKHEHEHGQSFKAGLTTLGGKFYAYNIYHKHNQIVTLEFLPYPAFSTRGLLEDCSPTGYTMFDCCILEGRGELFVLSVCYHGISDRHIARIVVHKLDVSRGAWLKVDTLGDMVIFFDNCRGYGASFDAHQLGLRKRDCIYFLMSDDKALYVYDMKRGTTAMHNPGPSLRDSLVPQFLLPSAPI